MVHEKPPSERKVKELLADSRINFLDIDRLLVSKFDRDILSKIGDFYGWLEEEKDTAKGIIRNETGRIRLPRTPKRGYCFTEEADVFRRCRKSLLDSVTPQKREVFANDRNGSSRASQTPKSAKRAIPAEELMSVDVKSNGKAPKRPEPVPRKQLVNQQTPSKVNKHLPILASGHSTPIRTPISNAKATTQKIAVTPKAANQRITVTPKTTDHKVAVTPKTTNQQPIFKRSEVLRKMETRTNTVIKNKEELMKEKAERARRDREERALRVKMNNKKKEEEALEKLRIIKMREQQIEALRQKQRAPQRAVSKSPCRTRGYYNRLQKPLVRTKSSQEVSESKNEVRKDEKKMHGKRNRSNSAKQKTDVEIKRQKLDRMESSANGTSATNTLETAISNKVDSEDVVTGQVCTESSGSSSKRSSSKKTVKTGSGMTVKTGAGMTDKTRSGMADKTRSGMTDETRSGMTDKTQSESSINPVSEPKEAPAINEHQSEKSLQGEHANVDEIMQSPVRKESKGSEENMDEKTAEPMEIESVSAKTSTINDQTFDKSMDISSNETLNSVGNNYDVASISSNDETDDEDHPRKPVPLWAQGEQLENALRMQALEPPIDINTFFGPVRTPKLDRIFARNRTRYNKRTSSAQWTSPMSNPEVGTSKFFEVQNTKRIGKPQ